MSTQRERQELHALIARDFPAKPLWEVTAFCNSLLRHAKTHGALAVEECNGPGDYIHQIPYPRAGELINEWQNRLEVRQERTSKRITELCAAFGVKVKLGGDPRGCTVHIHLPSGHYNTMGGRESGFGVPQ